jgi:mono/diheme cytochrome c family protein
VVDVRRVLAATAIVWAVAAAAGARAQQETPRIWQGVFTTGQADRGKAAYDQHCIRCHGVDLGGTGRDAPQLKGERFQATFGTETVDRLYTKIRDTMPQFLVNGLEDKVKIDIVAYILRTNGFPAGGRELTTASEELSAIQIVGKGEQPSVTNFSLVQTVGCLTRGPNDSWLLTNSAEPSATRDDAPSDEALTAAAARPLGTARFLLLNARAHDPAAHVGHRMEARGLVYREGADARLTVTSLKMVGECGVR